MLELVLLVLSDYRAGGGGVKVGIPYKLIEAIFVEWTLGSAF